MFSRYLFHAKVQESEETFENFVTELKLLARDCGYQQSEEMVRDQIVFGVKSAKVRARLIQEGSSLTLEKAVDIGRTMELSEAQLKTMTGDEMKIHSFKKRDSKPDQRHLKNLDSRGKKFAGKLCGKCGYSHEEGKCPAKGKQCNKCKKYNHFAKVCKSTLSSQRKKNVQGLDVEQ